MSEEKQLVNHNSVEHRLILSKIDASRCSVRAGDRVTPEQLLGPDADTGQPLYAGCDGRVQAIQFSGAEHALLVLIRCTDPADGPTVELEPVYHRIEATWCPVRVGMEVSPDTVLGHDAASGDLIRAGIQGKVESISFQGASHTLTLLIRPAPA